MFSFRSLRRAACATGLGSALVLVAHAQAQPAVPALTEPARTLQASDAASPVPALPYRSVFADLPKGVEEGGGDWKAANKAPTNRSSKNRVWFRSTRKRNAFTTVFADA